MEWISVNDRLPKLNGECVLCYCRINGRFVGSYSSIGDTNFGQWGNSHEIGILPPTHWMPLPNPPID
jgi:hypothetical protein